MPKSRRPRQTASQEKFKREVKNLKARIKRAEKSGFIFPEDIVPSTKNLPRRVPKALIDAVKKIKDEELYKKAISFVTQEKAIPISQGIELTKKKRIASWTANLPKKGKAISAQQYEDEQLATGLRLLDEYNTLGEEQKMNFIRSLSNEDYDAFTLAKSRYGEVKNGREEIPVGGQAGQSVLPDEGSKSYEDYDEQWEEDHPEIVERERAEIEEAREAERKKANEEITDKKVKEWKENYERQKKLKKKDREYIYDGDAIYAGILSRIEQFESDYRAKPERFDKYGNKAACVSFKQMLNNEIRTEGFSNVMRRLDGRGIEIDTALETMLYDSDENKVSAALMQLAEIIKGRVLTQQESAEITATSEAFNYDEADEQLERFQIDQLT